MVDLHTHSTCSDGTYTPTELVDYAIEKKLSAFALTDHDTVLGLDKAINYANELKKQNKPSVNVIPGVEFSTEHEGKDVHIVGLNIEYHNKEFNEYLNDFVASRDNRNIKMCKLLNEAGIDVDYERLLAEFPNSVITRAHFAKYMLKHGYTSTMKEGFDKYIGDDSPCYVPREKITPAYAVKLILSVGGIPVLAHPILYHLSDEKLDKLTASLKAEGLVGIEALYTTYSQDDERKIRKLAKKYDLKISGGSDFHGANKPGIDMAVGFGNLYIDDSVWSELAVTVQP